MTKTKLATLIGKMGIGGAERVAATITTFLPPEKYQQDVIIFERTATEYPINADLIHVKLSHSYNPLRFLQKLHKIYMLKSKNEYDVCISHLYTPNIINLITQRKEKNLLVIHGPASISTSRLSNFLALMTYKKADKIITVSEHLRKSVISKLNLSNEQVTCIHNPIDFQKILQLSTEPLDTDEETNLFNNHQVFICVGRLSAQKGQIHAIRIFSQISRDIPTARLVFLGNGSEEETNYLHQSVHTLKLQSKVYFLGNKENPFRYIQRAFSMLYPSRWDGLPMVILESLACGTPVISSDCNSGPREILAPHTPQGFRTSKTELTPYGILCPECTGPLHPEVTTPLTDAERLFSEAAMLLSQDEALLRSFQQMGIERARQFDIPIIKKQYEKVIDSILSSKHSIN